MSSAHWLDVQTPPVEFATERTAQSAFVAHASPTTGASTELALQLVQSSAVAPEQVAQVEWQALHVPDAS